MVGGEGITEWTACVITIESPPLLLSLLLASREREREEEKRGELGEGYLYNQYKGIQFTVRRLSQSIFEYMEWHGVQQ